MKKGKSKAVTAKPAGAEGKEAARGKNTGRAASAGRAMRKDRKTGNRALKRSSRSSSSAPTPASTASASSAASSSASPTPETARDRLVASAMRLFYDHGFEATSVKDVLEDSGVNAGSLYYYFPAKEDLLIAVLELYLQLLRPMVLQPVFDRVTDPIERMFAVMDGYRGMLTRSSFRNGCPIGNLALEMGEKSERVRHLIAQNFANWRLAIRNCLEDAGDRMPRDVDHDQLCMLILSVMEGGVMQSKSERRIEPFDASVAALRDYLQRLEKDAGGEQRATKEKGKGAATRKQGAGKRGFVDQEKRDRERKKSRKQGSGRTRKGKERN